MGPQGYLGEALEQQRHGCNGEVKGWDRLGQVAEGQLGDTGDRLLLSGPTFLDLGVFLG